MSAQPPHQPISGANPGYYDDSTSVVYDRAPSELAGSTPTMPTPTAAPVAQPAVQQPQTSEKYAPPPGPPPAHHYESAPPSAAPPAYSEEESAHVHFAGDEKPPVYPPPPSAPYTENEYLTSAQSTSSSQQQRSNFSGVLDDKRNSTTAVPGAGGMNGTAGDGTHPAVRKSFGERIYKWGVRAGVPINKITNKLGSEAFWPTSMDKECDKAARILKSFCKDGFYTNDTNSPGPSPGHPTTPGPTNSGRALVKIPAQAIAQAKGLAIFTTFRTGFHFSGAGGSGIIVARLPDGSWSPPSGFLVHTLGAGFMVGLDIYDCVCVLNTDEAVRAFTRPRLSLGGEMAVVAGPVGAGTSLEGAIGGGRPVWSYMKSRGFYAGVQADGTIIVQRPDANAAFYGEKLPVERILRGEVRATAPTALGGGALPAPQARDGTLMWPFGARQLIEVLRAAEGKKADERVMHEVGAGPTPGDLAGTEGLGQKEQDMKENVRFA